MNSKELLLKCSLLLCHGPSSYHDGRNYKLADSLYVGWGLFFFRTQYWPKFLTIWRYFVEKCMCGMPATNTHETFAVSKRFVGSWIQGVYRRWIRSNPSSHHETPWNSRGLINYHPLVVAGGLSPYSSLGCFMYFFFVV